MKTFIYTLLVSIFFISAAAGQGCVAVRHMSCAAPGLSSSDLFKQKHGKWQVNTGYRYFRSFRHFRGDVEEHERIENNTEVVNLSHALDLGLSFQPTNRLSFAVNVPLLYNDRSSLYEHYGNSLTANPEQKRFYTHSAGIGDVRVSSSYWLIDPMKLKKYNVALGLGVKLPTGNYRVEGDFHKLDAEKQDYIIRRPVDQSIQLGDGGLGFSLELQAYLQLGNSTSLYANGFYLFNPRETNGVSRNPASNSTAVDAEFSVPDQFAARLGISQTILPGLSVMLGGRAEGVPSKDLIGGSAGFRRPGYIVSVEPGVAYMKNGFSAAVTVPVALYRNRTKSFADLQDPTGQRHGDAAFADYLISVNVSRWF
ncbi:hypothetical protein [Arundinibacter roseus]|uniref:Transporter n=1 Tax=Arundinibacter roseus TaxID=2070510 RepID=A0A4R4KQH2_9BACT|nr:hypothetical protein [Arundinibacter roseus]TDB69172.1 hypothetical protein EZE20_02210 [Arundinibacter roseus]